MAKGFEELISKVNSCSMKTVSVAVAQDAPVLEAVKAAKQRNIANAILAELGATKTKINSVAEINNEIFVDFSADSEVLHSGTAGETAVLDSLGFTFVGNLNYDLNNHWEECSCGEKKTVEEHVGGEATCSALAICSVCDAEQ